MELRQLRYFLKAKEFLNFTEAAAALHISQSTLSQQIKQLEDELRVPLFNRIGKRITLTEAGGLFAEYALQSLNKANDGFQLLKDLNNLNTGKILIGVTYGLRHTLTQAIIQLNAQFPEISFEIVFGTSKELIEKLNSFELDVILTFQETPSAKHFKHQKLFSAPMSLVTSDAVFANQRTAISLKEISELPLALPASGYSTSQFMGNAFLKAGLQPKVAIEINDIPTLLELVRTGKWHTILTQTTINNEKELFAIPVKGNNMIRTAMIIALKEVYEKKAVTTFLDILIRLNKA
ncbi:LysR substrate-binding domain-containing protein [Flavobacterium sp. UBA4197]|uniref:LysR substrate-binding domain-containing protein n=1 Tax=Flavobacterium sp. UBA4197 TaxID=1946546 RepID=UPI0025807650|nr:LysR substrate-binding domain-containing protein [Flavobacterium sp. UBA4197]